MTQATSLETFRDEEAFAPLGGFWTDHTDAGQMLAEKVQDGALEADEAAAFKQFIEDGYAIIPGAVSDELIDGVSASLASMFEGEHQRRMSYWDAEGHHYAKADESLMMEAEAKLLDIHYVSEGAQNVIFAPKVRRFLELLFLEPALAFQSLYFKRGSEQGIHQDTAFVPVLNAPLSFCASWIALEDVQPGSGELLYVPGSHRLPHLQFKNGKKCTPDDPLIHSYEQMVKEHYEAAGMTPQPFLPKKGDVLFWSADLCHGGAPILTPGLTRRSLVTHYCPLSRRPEYAAHGDREVKALANGGHVISQE